MNGDLGHWSGSYSGLYDPMGNDGHEESGDIGYDAVYYAHLSASSAKDGFLQPSMGSESLSAARFVDISCDQNTLYMPSENMTANGRQQIHQQLDINTQVNHRQVNDSDCSTASSSSLSNAMGTPSLQVYLDLRPPLYISSPQSAPAERGAMMLDFGAVSPITPPPLSHHPPTFGEDMFDFPLPLSTESDIETQLPMPHILEWKRVIEQCGTNDFVPQGVYQPYTEADRKRYIRDVELHETIFFQSDESSELGVSLDDALKQRLRHLKDKDDRMFVGCGPSVSIRLQWPGYAPWSKQIPTMDFKNPKGHITRAKLAKNIATCIRRFAEFAQDKPMEAESDKRWRIGKRHIKVEDLILVSLHHVSKGSWQPQLRLRAPSPMFSYQ